ncbi:hypothetical protein [Luteimonas sp. 100069]|uniref:hypothetical protein n=1 Tax=Luteimonas sp. 100069 TaxID=2006109 RepID=UPI000F4DDAD3|nr:hypothetical protein [Luteimonas sp. 100069]RPD83907.1 hypothetical protein EGK76_14325 [Luteimonas sp. 100069]
MTWVTEVHSKAHILLGQIENARRLAQRSGVDSDALCRELYRKVDELYETEFPLAKAMDESDLVFHLEGPALRDHTPKLKLIEAIFSNIRQQVFSVAKAVAQLRDDANISDQDVELSLSALAPGSLYIGIKAEPPERHDGQQHMLGADDPILRATREAMRSIRIISKYLDEDSIEAREEVPDAKVRDAALVAVARLAPTTKSGIARVTIASSDEKRSEVGSPLTPKLRKELRHQLRQDKTGPTQFSIRGDVRELDLDFRRFELRRLTLDPTASVRCQLLPDAMINLETLAGRHVEVSGFGEGASSGIPRMLRVVRVTVFNEMGVAEDPGLFA